jgi:hypothetical protein
VFVGAVRGLANVATLVGQLIGTAVGDLPIMVFAIGCAALAHDAFNARCVVQVSVELPALDATCRLLDVGARRLQPRLHAQRAHQIVR